MPERKAFIPRTANPFYPAMPPRPAPAAPPAPLAPSLSGGPVAGARQAAGAAAAGQPARAVTVRVGGSRGYAAAKESNLTHSWTKAPESIDTLTAREALVLRARSRDVVINSDYGRSFIRMVRNNVAGPMGIRLQARFRDGPTGAGAPDMGAIKSVERAWKSWGEFGSCDIEGRFSWADAQRHAVAEVAKDGECLCAFVFGEAAGNSAGFALQFLDPGLLDINFSQVLSNGNYIKFGIEYSPYNRPVAYHILTSEPGYIRVEAKNIIHLFITEHTGQKRGLPWLSTPLARMGMLDGLEEAALTNARLGASKMGFFITPTGSDYQGDGVDSEGNIVLDAANPGEFEQLPEGTDFKTWDPAYPNNEYPGFHKSILRGIAAGAGVSYNSLAQDLEGVNFSSIRHGVVEERQNWQAVQNWFIAAFCNRIYREWLDVQLLQGTLLVSGKPLKSERVEKYRSVMWLPKRWPYIDPEKETNANRSMVNACFASYTDVMLESGRDPDEVWQQLARDKAEMKRLGLTPVLDTAAAPAAGAPPASAAPAAGPIATVGDGAEPGDVSEDGTETPEQD